VRRQYALSFGALLLIGGRLGDLFGRKRIFVAGLLGFAARAPQGALRALLARPRCRC
jgi:MFS family permease